MTRDELVGLLQEAGADAERAGELADQRLRDQDFTNDLSKSLDALQEAQEAQERIEAEHADRLVKAHAEGQEQLAEIFAPALDQFLAEQRAQNQAQAKALGAMVNLIKSQQEELKGLRHGLSGLATREELPRSKSVDYIPSPAEEISKGGDARADLFAQLEQMMKSDPASAPAAVEAVAMLESGADLAAARTRAGLV